MHVHHKYTPDDSDVARIVEGIGEFDKCPELHAELKQSPQALRTIVTMLQKETRGILRWRIVRMTLGVLLLPILLLLVLISGLLVADLLVPYAALFFGKQGASQKQRGAALALAGLNDVNAVPGLIDSLSIDDERANRAVERALTRMLPHMTAGHSALLNPNQMDRLCGLIRPDRAWKKAELTCAALHAIAVIGDSRALASVETLANSVPHEGVRSTAQSCLPMLRDRVEHLKVSEMLLRPGSPLELQEEILLRPAGNIEGTSDTLLRPREATE